GPGGGERRTVWTVHRHGVDRDEVFEGGFRISAAAECAVGCGAESPKIIEADLGMAQVGKRAKPRRRPGIEISEEAITQTVGGNGAQLLLDAFECGAQ